MGSTTSESTGRSGSAAVSALLSLAAAPSSCSENAAPPPIPYIRAAPSESYRFRLYYRTGANSRPRSPRRSRPPLRPRMEPEALTMPEGRWSARVMATGDGLTTKLPLCAPTQELRVDRDDDGAQRHEHGPERRMQQNAPVDEHPGGKRDGDNVVARRPQ